MAKDVLITPASGLVEFSDDGALKASIYESSGNLNITSGTNAVAIGNNLTVGGTITSTVNTGTAPLSVTSTTVVNNLNADLLDGNHGSYYSDYRNLSNQPFSYASTSPSSPQAGDKWVNSTTGVEYTYINNAWVDLAANSPGEPVFVQAASPSYTDGPYLWVQTGINGTGITFWVEDGQ